MTKEITTTNPDGYWFRIVASKFPRWWKYSWGTSDMSWVYRADLEYLGRNSYWLRNRTCNDKPYKPDEKFKRRHRKRCEGYAITVALIRRLLE